MLVGDKTQLGNGWYRSVVRQIESLMIGEWHRHQPSHRRPGKKDSITEAQTRRGFLVGQGGRLWLRIRGPTT